MKPVRPTPSLEDVLDAFALEPGHERHILERYLQEYPQYAVDLANLSHELSRSFGEPQPLSPKDRAAIDAAWRKHSETVSARHDLFASLSVDRLREIATTLGVPRQIITAFRERKVIVPSIPAGFLSRFAAAVERSVEEVANALSSAQQPSFIRSHKADNKPKAVARVTFEQLLIDAGVSEEKRAELMTKDR